jgi:hypothetical protein
LCSVLRELLTEEGRRYFKLRGPITGNGEEVDDKISKVKSLGLECSKAMMLGKVALFFMM